MTGSDLRSLADRGLLCSLEGHLIIADELELADAYRDAVCTTQSRMFVKMYGVKHGISSSISGACVGENHTHDCPVAAAKVAWQSAQDRRRVL